MTEQEKKKRGWELINKQYEYSKTFDKGTIGHAHHIYLKNNVLSHEENDYYCLGAIINTIKSGTCMLNHPKQGGNDRCELVQANCRNCIQLYLSGNELGVDITASEKWRME